MSRLISRKPRRAMAWLALPLVLALALSACSSNNGNSGSTSSSAAASSAAGPTEIRVGLVFPTSGGMAALGKDMNDAVKMTLEDANANGGIDGAQFKIFEGDSASDPATGATVAQRLIDDDQVTILIGSYASGIAAALVPVAQRNKVMLWEVGAVAPSISPAGNQYFLRTLGTSETYAAADIDFIENYLADKIGKAPADLKIAVAHEDGPFGTSVADAIAAQAKTAGLNVVTNIAYPESSPDMTPVVLQIKKANPDIVLITPLPSSTPLFWQAAQTQNLQIKAIIGSAGFSSSSFVGKFGASGVEGVFDVEAPAVEYMSSDNLDADAKAFLDAMRTKFADQEGHPCLVHCGDGLGGAYILTHYVLPKAIADSGSASPEAIWTAAQSLDVPVGGTPQGFGVKFDSSGDNTMAQSVIMQWQGGELKVVWPSNVALAQPEYPMPDWSQR